MPNDDHPPKRTWTTGLADEARLHAGNTDDLGSGRWNTRAVNLLLALADEVMRLDGTLDGRTEAARERLRMEADERIADEGDRKSVV